MPSYLQPGDTVAIVATARKISLEELQPAINLLENAGYRVKLGSSIGLVNHQLAGSDAERAADFQAQLNDTGVKAIFCARGGYGSIRIVDLIDWRVFHDCPKWIVGFSDITVLHSHINQNYSLPTIHGEMPFNFGKSDKDARSLTALLAMLRGESVGYPVEPHPLNRSGQMDGTLVGGNLSVLFSVTGSVSALDTRGKILFLEDLDEYLYHIDRMLMTLKRAGMLSGLRGLIVGGMTQMNDNSIAFGRSAEQIIRDAVEEYAYPVQFGFPAGHTALNLPLMLGARFRWEVK